MADLIVGISKTAVQLLADKVKSAIKEEAQQWKIVQSDLVFITGEFNMMQAFLDTATEQHVRNRIVRTWVRQVRDLSYDVEDCIEFVLQLDTTKRSWWLRLLPSCSCPGGKTVAELPVDEAVADTTLLRARVVDVSQRNIRYNLIADSASKPMLAAMDPAQKTAASSFDVLINAVKKTSGPLDLTGLVAKEYTDLQVVSVCGPTDGDLVTVAIVRKMYSDERIHKEFQFRAWVKLMHPFNPHEFLRSLMTQFFTHSCRQEEVIEGLDALARMQATQGDLDLINEFAQKINTHRYLIVLEDLHTMVQWDAIRSYLPDRKKGSRIVLLTHHPLVASQCTGQPCRVSELGQFSPGHSVRVYYKEGFLHDRIQSFIKLEPHHSLSNDLLGRDTEMDELFKKIQERRIISVWGMPGVGKSALVKVVYDGKLRTSDRFKRRAWVSVSHPFNPTDFCRSLIVSLYRESTSLEGKYAKAALQAEDPIKKCQDHLRKCVCLLVIDGLQSNEDWDWINSNLIQYGDSESSIIIITSEERVAKHCAVSIDGVYNIKGLDATAAYELFKKVDVKNNLGGVDSGTWQLLLSKCGGLPTVISSVARYMDSKPRDGIEYEMRRLSDNFMQEVSTNPEFDSSRGLLAWMHSYLDACPRHLKKYMLYLSIFPQDTIIRRRRLIRRWIAEGYFKGADNISTEKSAEKMFDEVAAPSNIIMQPVLEASRVIGYRVNGFFREYILSRPPEERIFFPLEVSVLERNNGYGLTTESIGQHLAIGTSWKRDRILLQSLDLSWLRSLTVFREGFSSLHMSDRMRVLRVLDLENAWPSAGQWFDCNFRNFEDIGKLPSRLLKFLSLRGLSGISRLPECVGDLVQLQTLDIRGTSIPTLPTFITRRLRKLQYIRAGTAFAWTDDEEPRLFARRDDEASISRRSRLTPVGGVVVPRGIERLEALRTLGAVCVNTADGGEAILREIHRSLPHMKKLELSGISRKQTRSSACIRLRFMVYLESLSLQFERNNHFVHWEDIILPWGNLRSLKMHGPVQKLPPCIKDVHPLEKLDLEMTSALFAADAIEALGSIEKLQTLRLRVNKDQDGQLQFPATRVNKVQDGQLQFPATQVNKDQDKKLFMKLQVLEITCKSKLHVTFDEGAMEKLEHLKLDCLWSRGSGMQVSGLDYPVSLKQVWLLGHFDKALEEALQQQLDSHPKKPAPKLEASRRRW